MWWAPLFWMVAGRSSLLAFRGSISYGGSGWGTLGLVGRDSGVFLRVCDVDEARQIPFYLGRSGGGEGDIVGVLGECLSRFFCG